MNSVYTFFKPLALILLILLCVVIFWFIFKWFNDPEYKIEQIQEGFVLNLNDRAEKMNLKNNSLTVISYNLGFAAGPMQNTLADDHPESFYSRNLDDFISMVKEKDAEILLLQEVDLNSKRSGYVNQLDYIMTRLGWSYAAPVVDWDFYFPLRKEHKIVKATVVISKFPIISNEYTLTSGKPNFKNKLINIFYYPLLWKSTMQQVKVMVGEISISLYNVHLCVWNREARMGQIKYLSEWINKDQDSDGFIVGGDFNFQAYIRGTPIPVDDMSQPPIFNVLWNELPGIRELLIDSTLDTDMIHKHFTFPERKHRYDFLFYSKNFNSVECEIVHDLQSSDHLPLVGVFKIFQQ
ncbi:endonuclease/exonuclease/phosphatase family protein [Maridesulfovibrio ferrireducens]|uniref:endonuclease/exonuclease/phosphatase family protein n=1 Tax=Maridesulfovibrio ferrireducens TaxID=246191 RepID=UPI001A1E4D3B|nr:endonuclease/exonuclease/phosphatase family protein [Maridesulfovibrio ferrireducens]MBI9112552.1 endonuclease/exonuclease/phosphatase family protein [Maridesulfovibrio ferrireducens]